MSESIFKLVPTMLLKYVAQSSGSPKSKVSESVKESVEADSDAVGVLGSLCLFAFGLLTGSGLRVGFLSGVTCGCDSFSSLNTSFSDTVSGLSSSFSSSSSESSSPLNFTSKICVSIILRLLLSFSPSLLHI